MSFIIEGSSYTASEGHAKRTLGGMEMVGGFVALVIVGLDSHTGANLGPYAATLGAVIGGAFAADGIARFTTEHGIEYATRVLRRK